MKLTARQLRALNRLAQSDTVPPRVAWRAHIILDRANGPSDQQTAIRTRTTRGTVAHWRKRYEREGISGLHDRPRSGRRSALSSPITSDPPTHTDTPASLTDVTLERLLAAATRTISRRGFSETRVSDIASEAGISPAAVHYYFKSKQEILARSLLWANERLLTQLAHATDADDPALVRLAKFLERTIPYPGTQADEYLLEIDLYSHVRTHRELLPTWEQFAERWIAHLRDILATGIADGSFTPAAPADEIAERIVAMTDGLSAQAGIGSARMPPERARGLLLRFAAEQLGVPFKQLEKHAHITGMTPSPITATIATAQ